MPPNLPRRTVSPALTPSAAEMALHQLAHQAATYAGAARATTTRRTYASAWRGYCAWCDRHGREPLSGDPETVALYAAAVMERGLAVATLRIHLAAIQAAHRLAEVPFNAADPRLALVRDGIARSHGVRPRRRAAAATPDLLCRMLEVCPPPDTPLGDRDRALLLLGFGAALRRRELVSLTLDDVTIVPGKGVQVLVRRSKTDQQGRGELVAVWGNPAEPGCCALVALQGWLVWRERALHRSAYAGMGTLPLFVGLSRAGRLSDRALADKAVWRLVRNSAKAAGIEGWERFTGHSLRAGLATAAGDAGADLAQVMRQTRHRSAEVAMGYLRPADLWRRNPTETIWRRKADAG